MRTLTNKEKIMADTNNKPFGVGQAAANGAMSVAQEKEEDNNLPYTYKRMITVQALTNYSNYRKVNIGVLGRRTSSIGSSISSTNILSANAGEVEAYYPALIGLAANHPDFVTRVKDYLSNIQVRVTDKVSFNNSFIFNHKSDYYKFKAEEDRIASEYESADKHDLKSLKDAIQKKITATNAIEGELYKVGRPENVVEYIIYRHVLLYKEVAKDMSIANSDRSVRFYLVDEAREKNKQEKKMRATQKAMQAYLGLGNSKEKFNAVYVRYCSVNHYPLAEYMSKDEIEKNMLLTAFVNEDPIRFNDIVNDTNLLTVSMIERLIARGELVRSEYNQQINTADGSFIGKNMNDAVAYFNNPANKAVRDMYESKLKLTD